MKPSLLEFVTDRDLLGLTISPAQRTLLKALDGLRLEADELDIRRACMGRETYLEGHRFTEATVIAGARAGKDSRIAAPVVLYEATFGGHEPYLNRGERGVIPLVAQDQRATRVAYSYIRDYATGSPILRRLIDPKGERESELRLTNGMHVTCFASRPRASGAGRSRRL